MSNVYLDSSSVTYPAIGRCGVSCRRCGCECGGCASLNEMIHLQWETTASPEGDVASPVRDAASPNFGICDTTPISVEFRPLSFLDSIHNTRELIYQLYPHQRPKSSRAELARFDSSDIPNNVFLNWHLQEIDTMFLWTYTVEHGESSHFYFGLLVLCSPFLLESNRRLPQ
jgi:hypothetical protein